MSDSVPRSGFVLAAEVVVLEKNARWSPELHRQFQLDNVIVRACRDIATFRERVSTAQNSRKSCVAVLNPQGWPGECLPVISWLRNRQLRVVVVGNPEIELLEPSLRELGTTAFLVPPVAGHEIHEACRRLLSDDSIQFLRMGTR